MKNRGPQAENRGPQAVMKNRDPQAKKRHWSHHGQGVTRNEISLSRFSDM